MWQIIRELVAGGVTIFLTTQYLDEADQLADRIAVLDQGRLIAEGTAAELKRLVPGGHIRCSSPGRINGPVGGFRWMSRERCAPGRGRGLVDRLSEEESWRCA